MVTIACAEGLCKCFFDVFDMPWNRPGISSNNMTVSDGREFWAEWTCCSWLKEKKKRLLRLSVMSVMSVECWVLKLSVEDEVHPPYSIGTSIYHEAFSLFPFPFSLFPFPFPFCSYLHPSTSFNHFNSFNFKAGHWLSYSYSYSYS